MNSDFNSQMNLLKLFFTKISFITLISIFLVSCKATKHLNNDEVLLSKNEFIINNDTVKNPIIKNIIKPQPNSRFLGIPLRLDFYNLAKKNPELQALYMQELFMLPQTVLKTAKAFIQLEDKVLSFPLT